ncbi:MAG: ribonuclease P protein component [Candidatus Uhrbacteria bacterium]|nr:ribonuclease P protein component [Candidatus Uhrbacteria bacterium]
MLPQAHRLRLEKDIKTLFACGKSVFGSWVGMKFRKNNLSVSRFAIVAGVKVSKKAVVRNRLKRQVRAVVQEALPCIASGYDVLLFMKPAGVEKSFDDLKAQILISLRKAKLLSL